MPYAKYNVFSPSIEGDHAIFSEYRERGHIFVLVRVEI